MGQPVFWKAKRSNGIPREKEPWSCFAVRHQSWCLSHTAHRRLLREQRWDALLYLQPKSQLIPGIWGWWPSGFLPFPAVLTSRLPQPRHAAPRQTRTSGAVGALCFVERNEFGRERGWDTNLGFVWTSKSLSSWLPELKMLKPTLEGTVSACPQSQTPVQAWHAHQAGDTLEIRMYPTDLRKVDEKNTGLRSREVPP